MIFSKHILYGLIFSIICFFIFPQIELLGMLLIFFSSLFIDSDHFLYYFYKNKNLNFVKAYKEGIKNRKKFDSLSVREKKKYYRGIFVFHGIEVLIILILLGLFVSGYFLYVFIGFSFHLFLDIIDQKKRF